MRTRALLQRAALDDQKSIYAHMYAAVPRSAEHRRRLVRRTTTGTPLHARFGQGVPALSAKFHGPLRAERTECSCCPRGERVATAIRQGTVHRPSSLTSTAATRKKHGLLSAHVLLRPEVYYGNRDSSPHLRGTLRPRFRLLQLSPLGLCQWPVQRLASTVNQGLALAVPGRASCTDVSTLTLSETGAYTTNEGAVFFQARPTRVAYLGTPPMVRCMSVPLIARIP